ncbi:hypothetical protein SAMN05443572_110132 [Myxococcus fulvus]|uniref:Uncharacterized protein n=2 Tax=Myxococcus fulvus TaxID=33 RepID=A0A511T7V3_MYXFU|nr:hypothetical protein MFU01_53030 [Myxococcus fulvus]SEU34821.1 hypothetical protein SAMN05443572_110132 [Myxococcus fulvus]
MSDYLSHLVARQVRSTEGVRPRTASYFAPEARGVVREWEETSGEASRAPLGQVRPHREPWSAVGQVLAEPMGTQAPRSGEARDGVGPLLGEPRSRGGPGVGEGHFGRRPDSTQTASRGESSRERAEALVSEGPARHPGPGVSAASTVGPRTGETRASDSRDGDTATGLGQSSRSAVGTAHEGREARHEPGAAWNSAEGAFTRVTRARTLGSEGAFTHARTSGEAGVVPRARTSGAEGLAARAMSASPSLEETDAGSPLSRSTEHSDESVGSPSRHAWRAGEFTPRTEHEPSRGEGSVMPRGIVPRAESLRASPGAHEVTRGDVTAVGLSLALETTRGMARDSLAEEQGLPMRPASPVRQARALAAALESDEGDRARGGHEPRAAPPAVTQTPEAPVINVTIGRIEVRAVAPAAPPRSVPARPSASPSLEDYLARRNGGGR